jgi:hypothetical protein
MSIRDRFKKFVETHICAELPDEFDDEKHYGFVADRIARRTGLHPACIKEELDRWEAFGIDTHPDNLPDLMQRFIERHAVIGKILKVT